MSPDDEEFEMEESENQEETCLSCGMDREDWSANQGEGFKKEGETYCCQGCAEGTGCTCAEDNSVSKPTSKRRSRNRR
jgi:hypothetical protein